VQREKLKSEAEKIQASIFENACDQRDGHFVGAFGENFVDATLLLLPRVGFIEPDDPRMQATRRQINKRLRSGVFIRRYDADDNIASNEGAFMVCGFWAIDDLVRCGRLEEAEESLDALVRCANDVGLLSEEIRPHDQAMLGNFPQAFSHSGLVNAALALAASKEKRSQS
jgi:GH15 family glucan-1,4-alpha-glucosidase